MFVYIPLVLIAGAYFVYWFITRNFNYWKDRNVPTPPIVPLFGSFKDLAQRKKFLGCVLRDIYEQFPNEKIVGVYRMTTPALMIRDLDLIKQIMIKDFDNFTDRGVKFSEDGLGANLFHAETNTWRVLRARFTPLFTSGKLKNMFHLVEERSNKVFEPILRNVIKPVEYDLLALATTFTKSTIIACAFGLDLDVSDPKFAALKTLDKMILNPSYFLEVDMMFPGLLKMLNTSVFPAEVTNFFEDLVKTVVSQRNGKPTDRKDLMDVILEMRQERVIQGGKHISDTQQAQIELTDGIIAAQAFIFYAGGYDTSASTITFLLYELTQNLEVQDKLIREIDDTLKKCNNVVTFDVLADMPYLTKTIDETLRKYPIVEPLQRCAQHDYKIPGTEVVLKKGLLVYLSAQGVHYDEKIYPNPELFDPERFSPENIKNRHPCAYMPFGIGPRNCIGLRFGNMQVRAFLVKLLSNFKVEPSQNTPKKMTFEPNRLLLAPLNVELKANLIPRIK